jgi:hypothetical protein
MAHRPDYELELELAYAMADDESYRRAPLAVREDIRRRLSFWKPEHEGRREVEKENN